MAKYGSRSVQASRIRDETQEKGNSEERFRAHGEEPKTGDCNWVERSAREGRQGSVAAFFIEEAIAVSCSVN